MKVLGDRIKSKFIYDIAPIVRCVNDLKAKFFLLTNGTSIYAIKDLRTKKMTLCLYIFPSLTRKLSCKSNSTAKNSWHHNIQHVSNSNSKSLSNKLLRNMASTTRSKPFDVAEFVILEICSQLDHITLVCDLIQQWFYTNVEQRMLKFNTTICLYKLFMFAKQWQLYSILTCVSILKDCRYRHHKHHQYYLVVCAFF